MLGSDIMTENNILEFQHISKQFPGVLALDDVSISFKKGEVFAIVGENGAGKSTLIKTCTGAHSPTSGKIIIDGEEVENLTPIEAIERGVGVIYQEFSLVNDLSVAENIFLGAAIRHGPFIDKAAMAKASSEIFEKLNIKIDPYTMVKDLSTGYQQMVEMAKAISKQVKILIMDEPTAPLTNNEVETMYSVIRNLKESGVTVIYISHRLEEIFQIADRVAILRDGKLIKTLNVCETCKDELIKYMVGRELKETYPQREPAKNKEVVMKIENLSGNGLHNISLDVYAGEILGLGGLIGAGRTELAELLYGAKKKTSGTITYKGRELTLKSPSSAIENGIGLVPEDRKREGIITNRSIYDNISAAIIKKNSRYGFINKRIISDTVEKYKNSLRIKVSGLEASINSLSGGNQQKAVLAKILATSADFIILDEPTRGIDVGAKYEIYLLMNDLIAQGKTILMISSELEELMGMSDRIVVLSEGYITGELQKDEFSQERILQFASKQNNC